MKKLIYLPVIIFLVSCAGSSKQTYYKKVNSSNSADTQSILWQQTAAEKAALCYQAFNIASMKLDMLQDSDDPAISAIIMDLDETVLDNSPYNGQLTLKNQSYSTDTWNGWVVKEDALLVPGALEFIQKAERVGIKIFYISNRSEEVMIPTMNNMKKVGIEVSEDQMFLKQNTSNKIKRRQDVEKDYNIIMLIGDNLADFHSMFEAEENNIQIRKEIVDDLKSQFGNKFIVLPNVMYGGWEKAMEKEDNFKSVKSPDESGNRRFIQGF